MAIKKEYAYYIERERLGLIEKNTSSSSTHNWVSPSEDGSYNGLVIFVSRLANEFGASLSDVSEIPIQFHETIVSKAISSGYKLPGNFNLEAAQYFDTEYEKGVREGKKYAKRHHTRVVQAIGRSY